MCVCMGKSYTATPELGMQTHALYCASEVKLRPFIDFQDQVRHLQALVVAKQRRQFISS